MSVRKVSNWGGNIIGKFPSLKLNRAVQFESTLERDYLHVLDYDQAVTFFEEQPLVIEYQHAGKARRYTPDFHIVWCHQNILIECKPAPLVNTEANQRKFIAARQFCMEQGWEFQIITDAELRRGFRLSNIKLLRRYACHVIHPAIKSQIYAYLQGAPALLTIGQIQAVTTHPVVALTSVLHMAFYHELVIDLDQAPIAVNSSVTLPQSVQPGGHA
ncbi:MAG: hypothetical protein HGB05_03095 [Chloroflexi bacterium]|nr:hypothetical protein [Chloroflexota bacterium]